MNQAVADYLVVLRRWWRIVVAAPLLAVTVTSLYFIVAPDEYSAESILFVSTPRDDQQSYYVGADYSRKREETFLALGDSPEIAQRVIDDLGLDINRQKMISRTELAPIGDTVLLRLTTAGDTPEQAEAIGHAYIEELRRSVSTLESVSGGLVSRVELVPVQPPSLQGHAGMFPTWMVLVAVGVLGLMAGTFAAVIVALLDGRIRRPADAAEATGTPVLAQFSSPVPWGSTGLRPLDGESGRQLRSTFDRLAITGSKVIMVTSAERCAGKTGIALTAARVLADRGAAVAFVDFDSRGSRIEMVLGLGNQESVVARVGGVTGRFEHPAMVQTRLETNWFGVQVIPFGSPEADTGATADHPGAAPMLAALRSTYDWVIVDTPAAVEFSDASRLARLTDAVVLAVKAGRTSFDELREVSDQLRLAGGHLAGVVFVNDRSIQQGD
jgi:Mrp family chromosome partitioning ATPase/capsular polysaccharide biosynthesis protein